MVRPPVKPRTPYRTVIRGPDQRIVRSCLRNAPRGAGHCGGQAVRRFLDTTGARAGPAGSVEIAEMAIRLAGAASGHLYRSENNDGLRAGSATCSWVSYVLMDCFLS